MRKALIALAVTVAVSTLGIASATAENDSVQYHDQNGGFVQRCNLDGVNPAYHPKIFGNAATAAAYGFVRSRDGTWQVGAGCGAPASSSAASAYAPRPESQKAIRRPRR